MKLTRWLAFFAVLLVLAPITDAHAQTENVLYAFRGRKHSDGSSPIGLMRDSSGNFFGPTQSGGSCKSHFGCGTVFELSASGTETVLYDFPSLAGPQGELVEDGAGNLYGTARYKGDRHAGGCGYVYRIAADHTESILYEFKNGRDGCNPAYGLTADGAGNYYGVTSQGGGGHGSQGCGIVYKISSTGQETALYRFQGGTTDGCSPFGGLALDQAGNIFGSTRIDGAYGAGTIFRIAADGTEVLIHNFNDKKSGGGPFGYLLLDKDDNLYGTMSGKINGCTCGAVFKVTGTGKESVLYSFAGGADGKYVNSGLVMDGVGNLYGTTDEGGTNDFGVVFKISTSGTETVLHSFAGGADGKYPSDGPTSDPSGNLYGVTSIGGDGCTRGGCGVIYEVSP